MENIHTYLTVSKMFSWYYYIYFYNEPHMLVNLFPCRKGWIMDTLHIGTICALLVPLYFHSQGTFSLFSHSSLFTFLPKLVLLSLTC